MLLIENKKNIWQEKTIAAEKKSRNLLQRESEDFQSCTNFIR